ncbi:MAG TPA: isochorismatase family protein [Leptospiraceae bacterium]|nr:isochorismatase family protein [Leptospirales bacterium]HMU83502.1 isochorismatase family protein [Leptospiraceae bacterium]HMX55277.1 isochorismatase family protein [Leptospiraceae bacterium]HMZ35331.1 isochorismatase family protein [Leptospiraceae bacterium]HNE22545.1 isochorismatase family protein [Leptospiraceae bacterium]
MTAPSILITQCLQNDFVRLIDRYEALPNLLHVGYDESMRLLGERMEEGPVRSMLHWAYERSPEELAIIHIRDWHNPSDPAQKDHLKQFGPHCVQDTEGARFVFEESLDPARHTIVNASGLNDFVDTTLEEVLRPYRGKPVRVGIAGVWTEAKVTFLAYDLRTRYPEFEIAVASPLTASSSRQMHFIALDQLKSILGVRVFSSLGGFTEFLTGSIPDIGSRIPFREGLLHLDGSYSVSETDKSILTYLFRDCKKVELKCLDGGFSGNVVLKARSVDVLGHPQVPTVIKIGARDPIAQERTSFERIEEVLGNNAPQIVDFAEIGERGAIKYRYAAMLDGPVHVFQDLYESIEEEIASGKKHLSEETLKPVFDVLDTVFLAQLGRLYQAGEPEKVDLLQYYDFSTRYAPGVRRRITALIGGNPEDIGEVFPGRNIENVCPFYEKDLEHLHSTRTSARMAFVHGDLNGRNIVLDPSHNVWMIDFFHAHRGHILRDLLKLENDIFYIFTKIASISELEEAVRVTDFFLSQPDLGVPPLPGALSISNPGLKMAALTVAHMRSYYPALVDKDREPVQMQIGLLRYAMHTISFDECNEFQKKWALASGSALITKIKESFARSSRLRIDFMETGEPGKIGMTILPGRKDRERVLSEDIAAIKESKIASVLCLITENEFSEYGVPDLKQEYEKAGLATRYLPILDQAIPTREELSSALSWVHDELKQSKNVLVHCVGGLGRSGLAAAAYLILEKNMSPDRAIETVREARGRRAIETRKQEEFLESLTR